MIKDLKRAKLRVLAVDKPKDAIHIELDLSGTRLWWINKCGHYSKDCPIILTENLKEKYEILTTSSRGITHELACCVVPANVIDDDLTLYPDWTKPCGDPEFVWPTDSSVESFASLLRSNGLDTKENDFVILIEKR